MSDVLGVGIDLVDVDRVARLLARRPAAEARLFSEGERAYCRRFRAPAERYAARFAAKEAVGKALGSGLLGWHDVEVYGDGRPQVRLAGRTERLARELGVQRIELSLTHTAGQAAAFAVAIGERPAESAAASDRATAQASARHADGGRPQTHTHSTSSDAHTQTTGIAEGGPE